LRPVFAGRKTENIMTKRTQRHSPEQTVHEFQEADRILAEGGDVGVVLRQLNVTKETYCRWRNQSSGLKAEDAKMLKQLEKQNLRFKKLLAEAELEKAVLK
jgi:putative transposase